MIDCGKKNLLGVRVDAVDYEAAVQRILGAARLREPYRCAALAVHGVMTGALDREQRYRLNRFELAVPDGQPVRWGLNLIHGTALRERVYGPELALRVCQAAASEELPLFLYGSRPPVVRAMAARLRQRFTGLAVVGCEPSRFRRLESGERQALIERIRDSGAALTLVGIGCPRQEVWAYELAEELSMPVLAIGAAFDFVAGSHPQAPRWMQRAGLEWLFRLAREPGRLWRRYLLLNPLFLILLALQWLRILELRPADAVAPEKELLFG